METREGVRLVGAAPSFTYLSANGDICRLAVRSVAAKVRRATPRQELKPRIRCERWLQGPAGACSNGADMLVS